MVYFPNCQIQIYEEQESDEAVAEVVPEYVTYKTRSMLVDGVTKSPSVTRDENGKITDGLTIQAVSNCRVIEKSGESGSYEDECTPILDGCIGGDAIMCFSILIKNNYQMTY